MQRQAVPLLRPEAPFVGTGMDIHAARDSGVMVRAKRAGTVVRVSADEIWVRHEEEVDGRMVDGDIDKYRLTKFTRSNQGTCINQRPIVRDGERSESR